MRYVALPNPLWSAQFQILGGPARLAWVGFIYMAVLVTAAVVFRLARRDETIPAYAHTLLLFLAGAQCFILLVGGVNAIAKALIRDNAGRMIEAHRTAPMSALTVVIGYVLGPCFQVLLLYAVGVMVGLGLAMIAQDSPQQWLLGNFYLLVTAFSLWPAAVFFSLQSTRTSPFTVMLVVGAVSARGWIELLPGLGLASGLISTLWCWHEMMGSTPTTRGLAAVMLVNLLMGIFWGLAAARRFRQPQCAALSPQAACALLGIAVVLNTLSIRDDAYFVGWITGDVNVMALAATLAIMLLGALPCLMAVQNQRHSIVRHSGLSWPARLSPWMWAMVGSAMAVGQLWLLFRWAGIPQATFDGPTITHTWSQSPVQVSIVVLLGTWMACAVGRLMFYLSGRHALTVVLLGVLWLGPPVLDVMRVVRRQGEFDVSDLGAVGMASPVGALLAYWDSANPMLRSGLMAMGTITGLALIFGALRLNKLVRARHAVALANSSATPILSAEANDRPS